jgi:enoyl-CoA hydratase/carnithine racemase
MAVVEVERRGNIALITLNRPEARNAISPEVSETMASVLDDVEADSALRAVVLTGRGEVFSAGADLKVVAQGRANDIARGKGGFAGLVTRDFPKPIIAAVNGPALAGGFEIVLSCDLVVAAETARFGIPEVKRGLMAAAGGLIRLPKRVPLAIALELAMTGDPIDAARALQLGLVNAVVSPAEVVSEAIALAERIGENSPDRRPQLPAARPRGRRADRGRGLGPDARADAAGLRERRLDRGRHGVRREAASGLAQHLSCSGDRRHLRHQWARLPTVEVRERAHLDHGGPKWARLPTPAVRERAHCWRGSSGDPPGGNRGSDRS